MPTKPTNWLGIIGVALTAVALTCAGIGSAYRAFVLARMVADETRIEAGEIRITALESDQREQDKRFNECLHRIDMHLLSIDMNLSNALEVLKTHQIKISGGKVGY